MLYVRVTATFATAPHETLWTAGTMVGEHEFYLAYTRDTGAHFLKDALMSKMQCITRTAKMSKFHCRSPRNRNPAQPFRLQAPVTPLHTIDTGCEKVILNLKWQRVTICQRTRVRAI